MLKSNIKDLMTQKNSTIRGLAVETGISTKTIIRARSDKWIAECRLSTLRRIAEALGVEVKELFEEEKSS